MKRSESKFVLGILAGVSVSFVAPDSGKAAGTCVADVEKVIATKPTEAMTTTSLPADLIAKLDEAARASLKDDPRTLPCMSPAMRIFAALSTALGHTFTPLPQQ